MVLGSDQLHEEVLELPLVVLASLSPVFRAMMEAPMVETRERMVTLPDVDSRAFEILLSVKMKDSRELPKPPPVNSVNTALGLLNLCRKYLISELRCEVVALKYLRNNIRSENVLYILQNLKLMNQTLPHHNSLVPMMDSLIKVYLILSD